MIKNTVCKVCKATVDKGAKNCPFCGARRKKSQFLKISLFLLLFILVLPSIASRGSKVNSSNNSATVMPTSVASPDKVLVTLDTFIDRYNSFMDEVEYQTTFGVNAKLTDKDIIIKTGEVNDTAQIFLPDYKGGALQLNLKKNTKNIQEIWLFLITRGPYVHPVRLLELFGALTESAGAVKEDSDVVEVMDKLGLYVKNAFESGKEADILSNGVNVGYKIMTMQDSLYFFGFATVQ